jgi:hypothetical protein
LSRLAGPLLTKPLNDATKRVVLTNGSTAAVLTQSERAVRGLRVQKLRCDEIENFDPDVWAAAQLTTRSNPHAGAAIEACGTFHEVGGVMEQAIDAAKDRGVPVLRWCLLDVLQRCEPVRSCASCVLNEECGGRAKTLSSGFVSIDDAVQMKGRVSKESWEAEMLCRRPSRRGAVFPTFDPSRHVVERAPTGPIVIGVDFGFANPFVALWIEVQGEGEGRRFHVVEEYRQPGRTVPEHVLALRHRPWRTGTIYCDPAGAAVNGQTGQSDVSVLRQAGFAVRHRPSRIAAGVELIRRLLSPADGSPPRLTVDPGCASLIRSLRAYRYTHSGTGGEMPLKDGEHDHAIDALRYALVNLLHPTGVRIRRY